MTRAEESDLDYWIVFEPDTARAYHDGELLWKSAYSVTAGNGSAPGSIDFETRALSHSFGVSHEHLVMSTAYLDGPEEAFTRAPVTSK